MTTPAIHRTMTARDWGLLLLLSVLWGGSYFFNQVAVAALPPLTVVVARVVLAAVILRLAMAALGEQLPRGRGTWAAFAGMGLLNNAVPFSLIVWGQSHIGSGAAAILNASTPLFTVILAHFLTSDERMTGWRLAGVLLGLAGVAVMVGGAALGGSGLELAAQLACLTAAISYALAGIFGRRFRALGVTPLAGATGQVMVSSLLLTPVMLAVDRPWTLPMPGLAPVAALVAVASLSTALAYVVYFRLLARAGATNALLVTFLVPVAASLLGIAFLGEVLLARQVGGMALIAVGLSAIDGRLLSRLRRSARA